MTVIKTLTLSPGFDIDILFKNGKLGYTFQYQGQNYGTAVRPESRKVADIAVACLLLITNAQETYKELVKANTQEVEDFNNNVYNQET